MKHPIQNIAEEYYSVREYSGKGMFNRTCLCVDVDNFSDINKFIGKVILCTTEVNKENLAEAIECLKTDQMGKGYVIYFPEVEFYSSEDEIDNEVDEFEGSDDESL